MPLGSRCWRIRLAHIAVGHAEFTSRSHRVAIRVYDNAGHVIRWRTGTWAISKNGEVWGAYSIVGLAYDSSASFTVVCDVFVWADFLKLNGAKQQAVSRPKSACLMLD